MLITYVFPFQARVTKPDCDLAQPQVPSAALCPCELWWPFPQIVSACCLQHATAASCSRVGTLAVPQNKPFPMGTQAVTSSRGNFVPSPNLRPLLLTASPWCSVHTSCSAAYSLPAGPHGRGKINREHCSCTRFFTPLPVAIPYPCHGDGNPWSYLPLCPLTGQPTSDVTKIQFKATWVIPC